MTYHINELVPDNYIGKPTNLSNSLMFPTREEAIVCYNRASKRLLNPPIWHKLTGWASAHFLLIGPDAEEKERLAEENDYFRLDIPGPGSAAGNGFDWVVVEKVATHSNPSGTSEWTFLKVHPCSNPKNPEGKTAHFFKSQASSSFIVERNGNIVTSRYHGRNETPNTGTGSIIDDIRNGIVAGLSAAGLSEAQWYALLKGFLSAEIGG